MPSHNDIILAILSRVGVPYKYRAYKGKDVKPPPFIAYYFEREQHRGPDERNRIVAADAVIELYIKQKNFELEMELETELSAYDFDKSEEYDDTEELYLITYALTITSKTRR